MPKDTIESSGMQTADANVRNKACYLSGATLYSNGGSGTMVLTIYDSASAVTAGKKVLAKIKIAAGTHCGEYVPSAPIRASYGLRCDVAGTSASYLVYSGSAAIWDNT